MLKPGNPPQDVLQQWAPVGLEASESTLCLDISIGFRSKTPENESNARLQEP